MEEKQNKLLHTSCQALQTDYPFIVAFFEENHLSLDDANDLSINEYIDQLDDQFLDEVCLNRQQLKDDFILFVDQMLELLGESTDSGINKLTIFPGQNKKGIPESFDKIDLFPGEIIAIVGPTGSGKSRLLQDIEWTANGDTPTLRSMKINDQTPDLKWRYSANNRLVAQLSQNMNFVMDLTCYDFLDLHAQSRMIENRTSVIERILEEANQLAGEAFEPTTNVTALSGGQSRALMIADTAILSTSPIVLIDEIENAGIDRRKALNLLVKKDKIVLMATHDPTLALIADRRLVISNGGISAVLYTTPEERKILQKLEKYDQTMQDIRHQLRYGEHISIDSPT